MKYFFQPPKEKIMKAFKKAILGIVVTLFTLGSSAAHAGVPVIDVANLAQAIQEVFAWAEQYAQMIEQLKQAKDQYDSITGSRGLGNVSNDPALQQAVPNDVASVYQAINSSGSSGLTSAAQAIRAATKLYNCDDRTGTDFQTCQAALNSGAQNQAYLDNAMQLVSKRVSQIQSIQDQINSTSDAKGIAELQARLQGENAQVTNDTNRINLLKAMTEAQQQAVQQSLKEAELKNLANNNNGSSTFTFVAH
jgi:type IV secretion system protein VirB5